MRKYKLKKLLTIKYGKNQNSVEDANGKYFIYGTGGVIGKASKYLYDKESILIGRKGSIENIYFVNDPFWTVDTLFYTIINKSIVIPKYLFYLLSQLDFKQFNEGTSIPSLRVETLNNIDIFIHEPVIQQHIVDTIGSIDDLIEKNIELKQKFNELAHLLYLNYENIKSNNNIRVFEVTNVITGKQNANIQTTDGVYPFFSCSENIGKSPQFSFDGEAILIAGNGVIDVKYYSGKFEAYQRTYVLMPKNYFYLFLEREKQKLKN